MVLSMLACYSFDCEKKMLLLGMQNEILLKRLFLFTGEPIVFTKKRIYIYIYFTTNFRSA